MRRSGTMMMCLLLLGGTAAAGEPVAERQLRIGVADSLFGDLPRPAIRASTTLMRTLVQSQAGMKCEFINVPDVDELAARLADKRLDLAVLQGVEYGWLQEQRPGLEPLVIAVKQSRHLHAHLLVHRESAARNVAELRGQVLGMATLSRPHLELYLGKACPGNDFFKRVARNESAEEVLDDLVDGLVSCALVDEAAYESFRARKPARFEKLRELARSETFPAAVIAYRRGALDEQQVERFRAGMIGASSTVYGRQLLTLWRTRGFEPIPDDYARNLAEIVKAYPRPRAAAARLARPMPAVTVDAGAVSAP